MYVRMIIVHIAGFPIRVGTHVRQRCAWCPHVLIDANEANVAVYPAPKPGEQLITTYQLGALVEVGPGFTALRQHEDGAQLPPESCASRELDAMVPTAVAGQAE